MCRVFRSPYDVPWLSPAPSCFPITHPPLPSPKRSECYGPKRVKKPRQPKAGTLSAPLEVWALIAPVR